MKIYIEDNNKDSPHINSVRSVNLCYTLIATTKVKYINKYMNSIGNDISFQKFRQKG